METDLFILKAETWEEAEQISMLLSFMLNVKIKDKGFSLPMGAQWADVSTATSTHLCCWEKKNENTAQKLHVMYSQVAYVVLQKRDKFKKEREMRTPVSLFSWITW